MGQRQSEIIKNHMEVYWHDYASASKGIPITEAGLVEKASVIGRTGLMLLECGTGAWRVRSSMNTLSRELGVTTTADIGLLSIEFTCFDGDQCYTQSLCLTNTGVNTSRLNRLEHFVNDFDREGNHGEKHDDDARQHECHHEMINILPFIGIGKPCRKPGSQLSDNHRHILGLEKVPRVGLFAH